MADVIHIDGSIGGGQVLRSSLSLSALTGQPFVIEQIRKVRKRPGLMRQHLTAVRAAASICGARVEGAELGSEQLSFHPGPVRPGRYHFAVGSAGSACLVCQTVLPPLMVASAASELTFEGGTHNPLAPPYPYLDQVFFPLLERMGVGLRRELQRPGYFPAGGGRFTLSVQPVPRLTPLTLLERGAQRRLWAQADVCNLPGHIAARELRVVGARLSIPAAELHLRTPAGTGPGNALFVVAEHENVTEMVAGFGQARTSAERVAQRASGEMAAYLRAGVAVGEHLADQLLLPLAMAGAGSFLTLAPSDHTRTNMQVIERFLPVRCQATEQQAGRFLVQMAAIDHR